jgi:NTE family protein
MEKFLKRLLKRFRFEEMPIPLGVVATDLATGEPAVFHDRGDVMLPVRASCSYPGLFHPVRDGSRLLVDGAMSMDIPAQVCRNMGATRVISVALPAPGWQSAGANVFNVVNRCFQIMQARAEQGWRSASDLILSPDVCGIQWNGFGSAELLIRAGEDAARQALGSILSWMSPVSPPCRA